MVQNYRDLSDIELFIKIEKYDPRAIEEVYQRYAPVLFPLIVRIANNPQAAENILIDVFISLLPKNEFSPQIDVPIIPFCPVLSRRAGNYY